MSLVAHNRTGQPVLALRSPLPLRELFRVARIMHGLGARRATRSHDVLDRLLDGRHSQGHALWLSHRCGLDKGQVVAADAFAMDRRAACPRPTALPIARPGAFALADSVSVYPASQIVTFDMARKTRSAAQIAAAKRGSETRRRQARTKLHAPRSALGTHASRLTPHAHMQPLR